MLVTSNAYHNIFKHSHVTKAKGAAVSNAKQSNNPQSQQGSTPSTSCNTKLPLQKRIHRLREEFKVGLGLADFSAAILR